ncbi:unnamed protein product [Cuscuta europaea]|uniref:Uncharacterized protein n=1 Tax=Cuscuta europaea TaxID=41803 RepID=A0A9P0ZUL6_CUSEU|nr:unnamed protein product [Cuscuta europaea]
MDLGFTGPGFTWYRGSLCEWLDRALGSQNWLTHFPHSLVVHRPILLSTSGITPSHTGKHPFRFLAPWLSHEDFPRVLASSWRRDMPLHNALHSLGGKLQRWNRDVFGFIHIQKVTLIQQLSELEDFNCVEFFTGHFPWSGRLLG